MLTAMKKTEKKTDRNRDDPDLPFRFMDYATTPIIIASFAITHRQVRFYQAVRKLVNIFAHSLLHSVVFCARSRVLATPKAFRELRPSFFRSKPESDGEIYGNFVSVRRSFGCAQDRLLQHARDACAPNYSRDLRPWRRSRARPRYRADSWSGRRSGGRCRTA